ncbi:hypothetical protein EZS27_020046, partial [termite gut metagenome]
MNIGFYYNRLYFKEIQSLKEKEDKDQLKDMQLHNDKLTKKEYDCTSTKYFLKGNQEKKNAIKLQTIYPGLCTGVGMGHEATITGELKLGFYFDYTTGAPIIPGSTIKGVLHSAFPQWENHEKTSKEIKCAKCSYIYEIITSSNQWDDLDEKSKEVQRKRITAIEKEIFDGIIGSESLSIYDRDIFLDAYISEGTSKKPAPNRILGMDAITPHIKEGMSYSKSMLKNPVPIPFLKV